MRLKHLISVILLLILISNTYAQIGGHDVKIYFEGNTTDTFYLARYYTDKVLIVDTSLYNKGLASFQDDDKLPEGIYLIANNKKEKLAEFLMDGDQQFSIKLFESGAKAEVSGSQENKWFFEHIDISAYVFEKTDSLQKLKSENNGEIVRIDEKIDILTDSLLQFRNQIITNHPDALFSKILRALEEPVIPDSLRSNQEKAYYYYKNHFWDQFDLGDERLLNTPLLPKKLDTYFNQLMLPIADSVIISVDKLLMRASESQKMVDYLVWHFVSEYQNPKIMGLDKVFVHLSDQYFAKGKVGNLTESVLEQVTDRANKIRPGLIGNQAPDLWLVDTTGSYRSFKEIDAQFTVIAFWDQTCSHCKKELEVLDKLYKSKKIDFEVFAVNSTNDMEGWKQYITEKKYDWINVNGMKSLSGNFHDLYDVYSVPVLYLLDRHKKIIAKRFSAEQLENIILNHK